MARILVVGSANIDIVTPLDRLPVPGETISVGDIRCVPGGKGANAAVAAARLGGEVRFIGCVGDDFFGQSVRESLETAGVECADLGVGRRGTGLAVILLDQTSGQNSIMVSPGANHEVTLPASQDVFAWADVVMLQLETPVAVNMEATHRARAAQARVMLDPAPAAHDVPDELLQAADILSPNETELATLTGMSVANPDEALSAARSLQRRGVRELVVKLGSRGAMWVARDDHRLMDAIPVKVVDTTAAGDAFTAALALALAQGRDTLAAMDQARYAGALACTKLGAQPSLPSRAQVDRFVAEHAAAS